MSTSSCTNCRFVSIEMGDGTDGPIPVMYCKRFPPQIAGVMGDDGLPEAMQTWPTVRDIDWCGEWSPQASFRGAPVLTPATDVPT